MAEDTNSKASLKYATLRGSLPWVLIMSVAYIIISWRFDYLQTDPDRTVEGLRANTLYLVQDPTPLCRGDVVEFSRITHSAADYRKVTALAPSVFQLVEDGYRIKHGNFDKATAMDKAWMEAARHKLGGKTSLQVPPGKVLIVNTELGRKMKKNRWSFKLVRTRQIKRKVTRTLLSRDIFQIGEPVKGECSGRSAL